LVLEEFANQMALRKGGLDGLEKLIQSSQLGSVELSTGLQVSGHFARVVSEKGRAIYFQTSGPTALALRDKELVGHGTQYHSEGFGSPLGKLKGINLAIEDMGPRDLMAYDIYEGKTTRIEFEGGVTVSGEVITGKRNLQGKIVLISFKDCTVKYQDEILFAPEWGVYDMAVGKEVVSAYSGPADHNSFDLITHIPSEQTIQEHVSETYGQLNELYGKVRDIRENRHSNSELHQIFQAVQQYHPEDWLCAVELYEASRTNKNLHQEIKTYLESQMEALPSVAHLIETGIKWVNTQNDL